MLKKQIYKDLYDKIEDILKTVIDLKKQQKKEINKINEKIEIINKKILELEKDFKIKEDTINLLNSTKRKEDKNKIEKTSINQHVQNLIDIASGNFGDDTDEDK